MTTDSILLKSIDFTENVLRDAAYLSKSDFAKKHVIKPDSPLSIESVYKRLREHIVDNKIPIKK